MLPSDNAGTVAGDTRATNTIRLMSASKRSRSALVRILHETPIVPFKWMVVSLQQLMVPNAITC